MPHATLSLFGSAGQVEADLVQRRVLRQGLPAHLYAHRIPPAHPPIAAMPEGADHGISCSRPWGPSHIEDNHYCAYMGNLFVLKKLPPSRAICSPRQPSCPDGGAPFNHRSGSLLTMVQTKASLLCSNRRSTHETHRQR